MCAAVILISIIIGNLVPSVLPVHRDSGGGTLTDVESVSLLSTIAWSIACFFFIIISISIVRQRKTVVDVENVVVVNNT